MDKTVENKMFGCDIEEFVAQITNCVTYKFTGASMVIAGLMSDAQELMERGDNERARQTLNRAKHLMFLAMDGDLVMNIPRK